MARAARLRSPSEYLVTRAIQATRWLQGWLEQLLVQQAIARAYLRFARAYPRWAQSLFDDYFLTHTRTLATARRAAIIERGRQQRRSGRHAEEHVMFAGQQDGASGSDGE